MSDQRMIIEMGMGNDLYGMDYTKAAARAIEDAIRHSSIPMFESLRLSHDQMRLQVTVGVQDPDAVDINALAKNLPRGRAEVRAAEDDGVPCREFGEARRVCEVVERG